MKSGFFVVFPCLDEPIISSMFVIQNLENQLQSNSGICIQFERVLFVWELASIMGMNQAVLQRIGRAKYQ